MTTVDPLGEPALDAPSEPVADVAALVKSIEDEAALVERELAEIDLLVQQARIETGRHETRRAQTADRLASVDPRGPLSANDLRELSAQLLTHTKRASLMEAQIDILAAKQKTLTRFLRRLRELAEAIPQVAGGAGGSSQGNGQHADALPPGLSRAVLAAQEDLRRDIARAMHDGPAQSIANIALQAEIVQRLMTRDPAAATREVAQLTRMVQRALDATKNFIFDVRPMVLDDLGLVPTLRRAARDRGRRAGHPVEFDSVGPDRRLGPDVESALFRIVDDALVGYLATNPASVAMRLDWTDEELHAVVSRRRRGSEVEPDETASASASPSATPSAREHAGRRLGRGRAAPEESPTEVPPALAAMISEQDTEAAATAAASAAATAETRTLPPTTWREIETRAGTVGVLVTLAEDGQTMEAIAPLRP